uniref:Cyclic nucleotide-binding domain-containing protein n=1 Tax=Romanomermis culicivorax TaxID=13658 RepID=A0A915KZJ2_ROMCU
MPGEEVSQFKCSEKRHSTMNLTKAVNNPSELAAHVISSFIFLSFIDPDCRFYYLWSALLSLTVAYNTVFIIARCTFNDLQTICKIWWFILDYLCDFLYVLDILFFEVRKAYFENGLLVTDRETLAVRYLTSHNFLVDFVSILPTDFFYLALSTDHVWLRFNRVLRFRRLTEFCDRFQLKTSCPNAYRIAVMFVLIFLLFHWNACFFFLMSRIYGFGTDEWVFGYDRILDIPHRCGDLVNGANATAVALNQEIITNPENAIETCYFIPISNLTKQYLQSFYFSALTLTTVNNQPVPQTNFQFCFVLVDIISGMLLSAVIVGAIGNIITEMNVNEYQFNERLDGIKQFMEHRDVGAALKRRIIKWFAYVRAEEKLMIEEDQLLNFLPDKLKVDLAFEAHIDILRRVTIFQDCEPGLLQELVLKFKLNVYSPGDYVCRKGDVGREMYIVKKGSLNVVGEDGKIVFATIKEGSVFGELSVLNIPGNKTGNRRSASVRSFGYSNLFELSKDDLWDTLREYPDAKRILIDKGRAILKKDNLLDESVPIEEIDQETLNHKLFRLEKAVHGLEETLDIFAKGFEEDTVMAKKKITSMERIVIALEIFGK